MHSGETVVDVEFEDAWTFLEVWIPTLLQDLKDSLMSASELAYQLVDVVKIFGRKILDFVSVDTLVGLLSGLLGVMPVEFFEGLRLTLGPPEYLVLGWVENRVSLAPLSEWGRAELCLILINCTKFQMNLLEYQI